MKRLTCSILLLLLPLSSCANEGFNFGVTYVVGTFTPGLTFGGGSVGMTFALQDGTYTKIGNMILFSVHLTLSAKGTSTGAAIVTGLPFTSASIFTTLQMNATNLATITTQHLMPYIPPSGTTITLQFLNAGVATGFTDVHFTNTTDVIISGVYRVPA